MPIIEFSFSGLQYSLFVNTTSFHIEHASSYKWITLRNLILQVGLVSNFSNSISRALRFFWQSISQLQFFYSLRMFIFEVLFSWLRLAFCYALFPFFEFA